MFFGLLLLVIIIALICYFIIKYSEAKGLTFFGMGKNDTIDMKTYVGKHGGRTIPVLVKFPKTDDQTKHKSWLTSHGYESVDYEPSKNTDVYRVSNKQFKNASYRTVSLREPGHPEFKKEIVLAIPNS